MFTTHFGREETGYGDTGRETDGDGHGGYPERHVVTSAEVEGHERQPDHTSGVHGKPWGEQDNFITRSKR